MYLPSEIAISKTQGFQNRILAGNANPLRTFASNQKRAEFMSLSTNDKEDFLAYRMDTLPSQALNMFGEEDRQDLSLIRETSTNRDPNTQRDLSLPSSNLGNNPIADDDNIDDQNNINDQYDVNDANNNDHIGIDEPVPPIVTLALAEKYAKTLAKRLPAERQLVLNKALVALQSLPQNCTISQMIAAKAPFSLTEDEEEKVHQWFDNELFVPTIANKQQSSRLSLNIDNYTLKQPLTHTQAEAFSNFLHKTNNEELGLKDVMAHTLIPLLDNKIRASAAKLNITQAVADGWKTLPLKTIAQYLLIFYPKNQNSELTTIQRITSFDLEHNKPIFALSNQAGEDFKHAQLFEILALANEAELTPSNFHCLFYEESCLCLSVGQRVF
jgi:hypothetical protein